MFISLLAMSPACWCCCCWWWCFCCWGWCFGVVDCAFVVVFAGVVVLVVVEVVIVVVISSQNLGCSCKEISAVPLFHVFVIFLIVFVANVLLQAKEKAATFAGADPKAEK